MRSPGVSLASLSVYRSCQCGLGAQAGLGPWGHRYLEDVPSQRLLSSHCTGQVEGAAEQAVSALERELTTNCGKDALVCGGYLCQQVWCIGGYHEIQQGPETPQLLPGAKHRLTCHPWKQCTLAPGKQIGQ